jgi:hypothetical protein
METEAVDKVIDLSKYTHCKVYSDDELVMFTDSEPSFDLGKKRLSFSRVAIKNCFQGKYLGTDFVVELYESDLDEEPTIFFYDSGIIKFGLLELIDNEAGRFVLVDNMEFEFDWANDVKDRLAEAIRQAEIEEAERRRNAIHVGDRVSFYDSYKKLTLVGKVTSLGTTIGVSVDKQKGNNYVSTRYLAEEKLTKLFDEEETANLN